MAENNEKPQPAEITAEIEEMAGLQFTDAELAQIFQIPVEDFCDKYRNNIDRGRLLAEAEVRKSMTQLAKQGSTPAQKQLMDFNKKAKATRKTYA